MKNHSRKLFSVVVATCLIFSYTAKAEIITLLDDSKIYGKIIHYFDGVLTIRSSDDVDLKLPAEKIKRIDFELPKPDPAFSKPQKTFQRYREALAKGDFEKLIDCFALQYQTMMMHQIGSMTLEDVNNMRQAVTKTRFKVISTRFKKNMAFMTVAQTHGDETARAEIQFVRENGEWKMIPGHGPMMGGAAEEPRQRDQRKR